MPNDQPAWPSEHIDLETATKWVASACDCDVEAPELLQLKRWGVTARFGNAVLKASFTPLFPQVTDIHAILDSIEPTGAPRLLASDRVEGQLWTLFEFVEGRTAEEVGTAEALVATARELARIQAAVTTCDLAGIPVLDVRRVPSLLLEDDLSDQPAEWVQWLHDTQSSLQRDADALADVQTSFDHPDMNGSNAIMHRSGRVILIDWEEATVGCPLFSIDRLLSDAKELGAIDAVANAYVESLGTVNNEQLDCAMRLVPLKLAIEFRAYARGLGWPNPHTGLTTLLLKLAKMRFEGGPLEAWLSDLFPSND